MMENKSPATILIVEDDDVDYMGVQRALRELRVANPSIRAKDGVEALEILKGSKDIDLIQKPLIILLDINMPRMNGHEFLDHIRADPRLKSSIVFMLTTSDNDFDIVASYRRNVEGYIVKSDARDSLQEALSGLQSHRWSILMLPKEREKEVA